MDRRRRRRYPATRSAMLTVAVPSAAVMGVAAAAASSVAAPGHHGIGMGFADGDEHGTAAQTGAGSGTGHDGGTGRAGGAPSAASGAEGVQPGGRIGQELSRAGRRAAESAARAGRVQQRLELRRRQDAENRLKAQTAVAREAARPKFVLPVTQRGLSAYFGQSGINWMSIHTGIDFPVSQGTPVRAVTDGTVRTLWNPWYGNMAVVTAPDGTQTLYCHLSGTRIRSGSVKAGTVIAYSGNTGNTTGPHLHFEVRPGGGQPVDPLPWLLDHGLDPR